MQSDDVIVLCPECGHNTIKKLHDDILYDYCELHGYLSIA